MSFNSASPRMKRGMAGRGGLGRGRLKPNSNTGVQQNTGIEGLYCNDRLVSSVTSVLGCPAKVTGKSGKQFEGIFKTISPEASLVLGKASQVDEQRQNGVVKPEMFEQFVIHHKDWVKAEFKDVNLEECCVKKEPFKTDTAISAGKKINGQKELERWTSADNSDLSELESHHSMENGIGWSAEKMFECNEKKYGVKSTYNEDMEEYTTKLEKDDTPEYREKEKFAAQKAEEINKESSLERNMFDSGRSEEQLYSSVVRNRSDRSTPLNWRQPHSDRLPEQRNTNRITQDSSRSPVQNRKETSTMRVQQVDDSTIVQVKEIIEKPSTEIPAESKPENKVEALSDVPDSKPAVKPTVPAAKAPVIPAVSKEIPQESNQEPSKARKEDYADLKDFSVNFKLAESKKKARAKKISEEDKTDTKEKVEEQQTTQETESNDDKKTTPGLNPNAEEFRPRTKRNTPSPRSSSTASSSGAPSPFQNNSPFQVSGVSPYPPNNIYTRSVPRPPRGGMRPEYMDSNPGYVNANNAAGTPFFAPIPHPPFMHQPTHPGMPYMPPGNIRHPGLQHPVFIQQHHQGPMMVPVGHGPYQDTIYYSAMPMIQSPPQITSPSIQQQQFNFPPTIPPNQVRSQPPVLSQQPSAPVFLVRQPNPNNDIPAPIQPTQIMTNRP